MIMKKLLSLILLLSLALSLCSCSKYISSYSAIGLVRSSDSHSCEASFHKLNGTLVFKVRKTDAAEGDVSYSIKADEGEIRILYDLYGEKRELAYAKAGEILTGRGGYVEAGQDIYIIIEATDAKGKVTVDVHGGN